MTGLAGWLLVLGVADLFRARQDATSRSRLAAIAVCGCAAVFAMSAAARPDGQWWMAWSVGALSVTAWVLASGASLAGAHPAFTSVVAYVALAAGLVTMALAGDRAGEFEWLGETVNDSALTGRPLDRVLIVSAVLLFQIASANIVIRLLLDRVGVPAKDNEKDLRGGRVLGPMERLLIVGLGLGGGVLGATLVVAAKALLRFPELRPAQGADSSSGASDVTEYFLIGSLASWLTAFAGLALASI